MARCLSRREWLKIAGAGVIGGAAYLVRAVETREPTGPRVCPALGLAKAEAAEGQSRVVIARNDQLLEEPRTLLELLNQGVKVVTGAGDPEEAWRHLFKPEDVVGIKVNCIAGGRLSSHPEVVWAIVDGLKIAGVPEERIIIWDRLNRDLRRGGFEINTSGEGVQCVGNDLVGYDPNLRESGSVGSLFTNVLTKYCTAVVNVPVLKDHDLAGVSLGLKNFYGAIHNPNKYHDNNCNPYVAELYDHPLIKEKVRLTVCDAILAQYHGGPSYFAAYAWRYNGLLIATDPVALDRVGARLIEAKRRESGLPTLKEAGREPSHIATAGAMGLGLDDSDRIEVAEI